MLIKNLFKQTRARRLKCNETKPTCIRCLRSRRQCIGSIFSSTTNLQIINESPNIIQTPAGLPCSSTERQLFYLLCTGTVDQVTGSFDNQFWTRDVLLASQTSPAIWYATTAFAAMHQRMKMRSSAAANQQAVLARTDYYRLPLYCRCIFV